MNRRSEIDWTEKLAFIPMSLKPGLVYRPKSALAMHSLHDCEKGCFRSNSINSSKPSPGSLHKHKARFLNRSADDQAFGVRLSLL